jgi:hypothetical protein
MEFALIAASLVRIRRDLNSMHHALTAMREKLVRKDVGQRAHVEVEQQVVIDYPPNWVPPWERRYNDED